MAANGIHPVPETSFFDSNFTAYSSSHILYSHFPQHSLNHPHRQNPTSLFYDLGNTLLSRRHGGHAKRKDTKVREPSALGFMDYPVNYDRADDMYGSEQLCRSTLSNASWLRMPLRTYEDAPAKS